MKSETGIKKDLQVEMIQGKSSNRLKFFNNLFICRYNIQWIPAIGYRKTKAKP